MENKNIVLGVEGEVGSGKTSMCKELTKFIPNSIFIDGGLIFRGILTALELNGIDIRCVDTSKFNAIEIMKKLKIEFKIEENVTIIYVNGTKIDNSKIETAKNSMNVSKIVSEENNVEIFKFAKKVIDEYRKKYNIIVSARDLVDIYDDMTAHIYITASLEERVKRRYSQYNGKYSYNEIKEMIVKRDKIHERSGFNKTCDKTIKIDITECKNAKESALKVYYELIRKGFIMEENLKLKKFNENVKNKRIAIIGIGTSNIPLIDYFYNLNANVCVFDNRDEDKIDKDVIEKIKKLNIISYFGKDNLSHLKNFDYIFRSPSCRPDTKEIVDEVNRGAILTSEIEKVIELSPSTIIGVTGSDGKTTTTTLIYNILKNNGYKCFLGGNIGTPLFTEISKMKKEDYVVLELSSFQLMNMKISPKISVVTNISPNHLNVHKDYQEYIDSKKNIFLHQGKDGVLVINYDNEITRKFKSEANGKVIYFSHKELLDDGVIFDESDRTIKLCKDGIRKHLVKQSEMSLRGEHNCENACAAIAATLGLVDESKVIDTIKSFKGVEHRLEFVREINGVKYFNDSIGTSPTRTIAGLNSFDEKIVLIAGGYDKHLDYTPIAKPIVKNVSKLILMGQKKKKIEDAVNEELKKENKTMPIYNCQTLKEVVEKAKEVATKGEIVLFSPASASFDLFKNFEDRGNQFKDLVKKL